MSSLFFSFKSFSSPAFPLLSVLRLTGKLSNRKVVAYIAVQFLASIVAMCVVACMFRTDYNNVYSACAVSPKNSSHTGEIFATEFFLTFIFTYVAFTVVFEDAESSKKETMSFQSLSDSKGLTVYASTPQRYELQIISCRFATLRVLPLTLSPEQQNWFCTFCNRIYNLFTLFNQRRKWRGV